MKLSKLALIAAMTSLLPLQHAFSAPIEQVWVSVVDNRGGTSRVLLDKMSSSMLVVANQLFLDKDTETVKEAREDYARLLTEIGERVFTGYELTEVELDVGAVTGIIMYSRPWDKVIDAPLLDLQFSGVEPETAGLLEASLPDLRQEIIETVRGASADASDWAAGVLRKLVRHKVEASLPEFKAAIDLVQEESQTVIQVVVYPVGQLVGNIKYELRSEMIPNLLLMQLKYKYLAECDKLRGLPVAYVEAHKGELEALIRDKLLAEPEIRSNKLRPVVTLTPGPALGVTIMIVSDDYKIWFEGYGDIGREDDNLSGKAHLGKYFSPEDEVFGEVEVILDDVQWRFGVGYARYWGKSVWSYTRRIPVADNDYKLEYHLSPKWRLRAEHFSGDDRNEFGVRYRIHEFLSAEGVYGDDEFYLRVIGNL